MVGVLVSERCTFECAEGQVDKDKLAIAKSVVQICWFANQCSELRTMGTR